MAIDRNNPLPLYYQVREDIRGRILSQEWQEGADIPTEKDLMDFYGVSRQTIRQALGALAEEGLITRQKGKGTSISPKKLPDYFLGDVLFTKQVMENRLHPGSLLLVAGRENASDFVARKMGLRKNETPFRIDRVRKANNLPMVLEKLYVHPDFDNGLEREELVGLWVMKFVERNNNIVFTDIDSSIRAVLPDDYERKCLEIPENQPVLRLENRVSLGDRVIIYSERIMRGDRFRFKVKYAFGKAGALSPEMIFEP